jgi:hypothetical protein
MRNDHGTRSKNMSMQSTLKGMGMQTSKSTGSKKTVLKTSAPQADASKITKKSEK